MITFKDLFKRGAKLRNIPQRYFATDEELRYKYNALCEECTRLATQFYEVENKLTQNDIDHNTDLYKKYLVTKEYLDIQQEKVDSFVKYHDIKF